MVDTGVYTKNRNFRLFLCSKFGKAAHLALSASFSKSRSLDADRKTFIDSLVSYLPNTPSRLLRVDNTVATDG